MVLGYFWPHQEFSWQELEVISAKAEGLWTWPTASMLWLHNNGFEVRSVELFDYRKFVSEKENYLKRLFGEDAADEQIAHSDIDQELGFAKQIVGTNICELRLPSLSELKQRLDEGYLLICNVNSRILKGQDGYMGHFVLLLGYTAAGFIIHDPGPPGLRDRHVDFEDFYRAWAYPTEHVQNYIAVRYK